MYAYTYNMRSLQERKWDFVMPAVRRCVRTSLTPLLTCSTHAHTAQYALTGIIWFHSQQHATHYEARTCFKCARAAGCSATKRRLIVSGGTHPADGASVVVVGFTSARE